MKKQHQRAAKRRRPGKKSTRKTAKRNSLVENIHRRKRTGASRPKSRSTVSKKAYKKMRRGWR